MLEAYAAHPDAFTSSAEERAVLSVAWWAARLAEGAAPDSVVYGAFDGAVLVGVAGLTFERREKARHKATLFGMYVAPSGRGLGVGRALVEALLAYARTRQGVRIIQLTVTQGNHSAESLYSRCGFVSFGVEPMAVAIGTSFVSKVHMWLELDAVGRPVASSKEP